MLLSLYIENYALIDKLNIDFSEGFNVITGETGAGKSIIVGALSMILGERASSDLIKAGKQKSILEAVFDVRNLKLANYEDDEVLIITRELQVNGRNICKINGRTVTQSILKETSRFLLDIHGQHQHQLLIDPDNHLDVLDLFISDFVKSEVVKAFSEYQRAKKEYDLLLQSRDLKQEEKDFLKYQVEELIAANIVEGEFDRLKEEKARLENFNAIADVIKSIENSAYDTFDSLQRNRNGLSKVSEKEHKLKSLLDQAESLEISFEDFKNNVGEYAAGLEFDPQRLEELVDRIDLYNSLKRKHLKTVSPEDDLAELLLQKQVEMQQLLANIEFSEEKLQKLKQEKEQSTEVYITKAKELSLERKKVSQDLSEKIIQSLQDLKMPSVQFEVSIKESKEYTKYGVDLIEFMISPNPGEPLKPLAKIASGGEISRIMLAIKAALLEKDMTPSMVFDEIDTGIGGDTANAIAEKISMIAQKHQVICITHLAQIASVANRHLVVQKNIDQEKTNVEVLTLSVEQRETEIARMLSGKLTDVTKAHAKELLSF